MTTEAIICNYGLRNTSEIRSTHRADENKNNDWAISVAVISPSVESNVEGLIGNLGQWRIWESFHEVREGV